jgi:hypothetical protein
MLYKREYTTMRIHQLELFSYFPTYVSKVELYFAMHGDTCIQLFLMRLNFYFTEAFSILMQKNFFTVVAGLLKVKI